MAEQRNGRQGQFDDLQSFPVLTSDVGTTGVARSSSGAPGTIQLKQVTEDAIRNVLGWRPKGGDTKGFLAALTQAFTLKVVDGQTEWKWTPRSYAVQPDMGAITGAQASLYARAKASLEQSLPLLEGLYPLRSDFDPQDTDAMRVIIRSEWMELVNELGMVGGPRIQRVDNFFRLLLGIDPTQGPQTLIEPEAVEGHLGTLRDRFGIESEQVNTVEEEQNLTNFRILVNYIDTLRLSWAADRHFFDRVDSDVFLGTQLVLLSRQLEVVAESVHEAYFAMDSVFLGAAERQSTILELPFNGDTARLTISELLEWVDRFSSEEGPHLLQDAGKDGVLAFRATIAELEELVEAASDVAQQDSSNPTPGFHTPRVRRAFIELTQEIQNAVQLAGQVNRFPSPVITIVTPNSATQGNSQVVVSVLGDNFQDGARVRLTRGSGSSLEEINAQPTFFVAETQLHALFDLATAPIGTWTVAIRNPDGQEFQLPDRFFIRTADSDTLTVQSLEPPRSPVRGDVEVTFTGNGLRAETSVNFGKDIEVKNTRLTLEGRLVATIGISPKATSGKRNVILTNPSSGQQFTLKDGFEVTKPATPKQA